METLRLRLLRLVAGLLTVVAFVLAAPSSRAFSQWVCDCVSSVLSRAEAAAQRLVIVQARVLAAKSGDDPGFERLLSCCIPDCGDGKNADSLADLRQRLEALRALLEDLPRFGLRLLRRTERHARRLLRAARTHCSAPSLDTLQVNAFDAWRLVSVRIDRPPDKGPRIRLVDLTSPGDGWEAKAVVARL